MEVDVVWCRAILIWKLSASSIWRKDGRRDTYSLSTIRRDVHIWRKGKNKVFIFLNDGADWKVLKLLKNARLIVLHDGSLASSHIENKWQCKHMFLQTCLFKYLSTDLGGKGYGWATFGVRTLFNALGWYVECGTHSAFCWQSQRYFALCVSLLTCNWIEKCLESKRRKKKILLQNAKDGVNSVLINQWSK